MNFLDWTVQSFARIFKLDVNPELPEDENVRLIIHQTAFVCTALTWIQPIPMADFLLLAPIHAKMTVHIGIAKGYQLNQKEASQLFHELLGSVGLTFLAQQVIVGVGKFVPVLFGLYLFPLFYAATWAMGKVVEHYFDAKKRGKTPNSEDLKAVYKKALITGKMLASKLSLDDVKAKAQEIKEAFERWQEQHGDAEATEDVGQETAAQGATKANGANGEEPDSAPIRVKVKSNFLRLKSRDKKKDPEAGPDPIDLLESLTRRREQGEISHDEYLRERASLLTYL